MVRVPARRTGWSIRVSLRGHVAPRRARGRPGQERGRGLLRIVVDPDLDLGIGFGLGLDLEGQRCRQQRREEH